MINSDKIYHRIIHLIGLLFFGALFIIAWIYFKERMLSFDPAYFSFGILESGKFAIACNRWGMAPSQFLPLIALKSHCSLETFLRLYSVSFILINYTLFLICTIALKNFRAAVALMLTLCLAFRWEFYYSTSELFMGMSFSILFWAIIAPEEPYSSQIKQWVAALISIPIIVLISYCQQLACFAVIFSISLELIGSKRWKDLHIWIVFIFALGWFYLRMKFFSNTSYELAKMEGQVDLLSSLPDFFSLRSWAYSKVYFLVSLKTLGFTFLFCIIMMGIRRQWLMLAFFIAFLSGYLVFLVLLFPQDVDELFFQYYATLFGLFGGITLMYLIGVEISNPNYQFSKIIVCLIISVLLFINVKGIYKAHFIQTERIHYFERLTEQGKKLNNKKYILSTKSIPNNIIFYHQFFPYETMLYSSLPSPDSALTFYPTDNVNQFDSVIHDKTLFLGTPWDPFSAKSTTINRNYYHLPATEYMKLNTSQADSSFHESDFNNKNVILKSLSNEVHSNVYNFIIVPIKITNTSGHIINSIPDGEHPVMLTYHLFNKDGSLLSWDNTRTPLELDVRDENTEGLMVYLPPQKGTYIIEADFVTEGLRWWNASTKFNLIVE
jgi:hypothetical protein